MDIHSVEFYVLALFVAFALVGVLFGRTDRSPARTYIEAMDVNDDTVDAPHEVSTTKLNSSSNEVWIAIPASHVP